MQLATESRGKRFVTNVMWNWAGVATSLFTGLILSPFLIRRLGPDGYGVWALSFALVDYYWFFDFGFRSATVKYVAHYTATGEREEVGKIVSTSFLYAGLVAAVILTVVGLSARIIVKFFQVAPGLQSSFALLIFLITLSWSTGIVFGLSAEAMNAVQRFDITNRISVLTTVLRAIGQVTMLYLGFGLIPLGLVTIITQIVGYILNFIFFRRVFHDVPMSLRLASRSTLRRMGGFGIHSFFITISTQLQNQSAPVLIGHFLPAAFSGYYSLPMRLVQYTVEFVGRIGIVTNSNAAELAAKGDSERLSQLAIYTNRYSLVIFMPLAILLWTYGPQFFLFWVGAKVAPYCAQVLPILLVGFLIGVVGQFSSSMVLMGMGRHQLFARGMIAETILGVIGLIVVIPRYGIVGAATVTALLMVANRGICLSYLVSRTVDQNPFRYLGLVYAGPFLSAIPPLLLSFLLRSTVLPGRSWLQLAMVAGVIGVVYYLIAFFACVRPEHRKLAYGAFLQRIHQAA